MPTPHVFPTLTALALAAILLGCPQPALAHGDEDHSQPATKQTSKAAPAAQALATAATGEDASPRRLQDGSLQVPKISQRQLGIRTLQAKVADLANTVELNGRIIAAPNAGGRVQTSQTGRIAAGPKGFPTLGQTVVKGQVLLWLHPSVSAIEKGNQRATLAELDSQLAMATARAKRYAQLEGAVPEKDIQASRIEVEALQQRRAAIAGTLSEAEALVAPASGVISTIAVANGQVVEPRDTLLEIVDPKQLLVEALAYDASLAHNVRGASMAINGQAQALQFVGGGLQLREQALPLMFRISSPHTAVAVGQPVKVIAKTAQTTRAVAVPMASVSRNNAGESVVWVHGAPERFTQRRVTVQALDGASVVLTSGVNAGERVVVEGANLLAHVR